jgi:hypothetical protein
VWTFATCVVLSHDTWSLGSLDSFDPAQRTYFQIHVLLWAPLKGGGLAGLILWAWRRIGGGEQIGTHPGHWLLIILGVNTLFGFANDWLRAWLGEAKMQVIPYWAWKVHRYSLRAFEILLYCAAIAQFRGSRWWQAAFVAMTLYPLSDIVDTEVIARILGRAWLANQEFAWGTATRIFYSAAVVFVVAAIVSDRRRGVRRDFLHFAGAAIIMVQGILEWPSWIVWWMIFR